MIAHKHNKYEEKYMEQINKTHSLVAIVQIYAKKKHLIWPYCGDGFIDQPTFNFNNTTTYTILEEQCDNKGEAWRITLDDGTQWFCDTNCTFNTCWNGIAEDYKSPSWTSFEACDNCWKMNH